MKERIEIIFLGESTSTFWKNFPLFLNMNQHLLPQFDLLIRFDRIDENGRAVIVIKAIDETMPSQTQTLEFERSQGNDEQSGGVSITGDAVADNGNETKGISPIVYVVLIAGVIAITSILVYRKYDSDEEEQ